MKRFLFTGLYLFSFCLIFAQEQVEIVDFIDIPDSTVLYNEQDVQNKKLHVGANVGMAYIFSSRGYGGPMLSFSPYVAYPLTKKFSLNVGLSVGFGSLYYPYLAEIDENPMVQTIQTSIYLAGDYQVSEKVVVSGSVYKQFSDVPNTNVTREKSIYDSQGMSLGVQYKITPSISFGAQIRVEEPGLYYGPFIKNPYDSMYDPFFW
jgi:hypothetical protein